MNLTPPIVETLATLTPRQAAERVGAMLRDLRTRHGVRASALAPHIGTSGARWSLHEAGKRPVPIPLLLAAVAALSCEPDLAREILLHGLRANCSEPEHFRAAALGVESLVRREAAPLTVSDEHLAAIRAALLETIAAIDRSSESVAARTNEVVYQAQRRGGAAVRLSHLVQFFSAETPAAQRDQAARWFAQLLPQLRRGVGSDAEIYCGVPLPTSVTIRTAIAPAGSLTGRPPARIAPAAYEMLASMVMADRSVTVGAVHRRLNAARQTLGYVPCKQALKRMIEELKVEWLCGEVAET